jgi:Methyltransferase domain
VRADPTAAASFKTAIARPGRSAPAKELTPFIKSVLAESPPDRSQRGILNYGCGRGADVNYFRSLGIDAAGYDPHAPFGYAESPAGLFTVVTLIFVLNVLSTEEDRREAIRSAAARLAPQGALIVATRSTAAIQSAATRNGWRASGDGFLSLRGTFQHGMDAAEIVGLGEMIGLQRRSICPPANVRDAALVALARRTPTPGND